MSSAIYLSFATPITLEAWLAFCAEHGIVYSPHTVGRATFYQGDVEIHFGESNWADLPRLPDGRWDFDAARPFPTAEKITVSTFWMGAALPDVARVALAITERWAGPMEYDPELTRYLYIAS